MTDEKRTAVLSAAEKICEIMGRLLRLNRQDAQYDLSYNGELGWLTITKWVQEENEEFTQDEQLTWRSSSPAGGKIFGICYYSIDEILAWLEGEANG